MKIKACPINTGEAEVSRGLDVYLSQRTGKRTVPFITYLIKGLEEPVLVDTGMWDPQKGERMGLGPHKTKKSNPEKNWDLVEEVKKNDVEPEDVKHIIFTHLHYEHVSPHYLEQLPNATIHVQRKELHWAASPIGKNWPVGGGTYFYDREDIKAIMGPFWDQVNVLDGNTELFPKLKCVLYGDTHTPGSQAVYLETSEGTYILTGDLIRVEELNIDEQKPPGIFYDIVEMERALRRLRRDGDVYLGTHDSEVLQKEVYP